jgi:hypothetical protein
MKSVPLVVWIAATVIAVSIIAGIVVLTVTGKPTDALTSFLTDKLLATITAVVTLYLAVKVRQVQNQTNGTTTVLTDLNRQNAITIDQQSAQLANSVPVSAVTAAVTPAVVAAVAPVVAAAVGSSPSHLVTPGMSPTIADLAAGS